MHVRPPSYVSRAGHSPVRVSRLAGELIYSSDDTAYVCHDKNRYGCQQPRNHPLSAVGIDKWRRPHSGTRPRDLQQAWTPNPKDRNLPINKLAAGHYVATIVLAIATVVLAAVALWGILNPT